MSEANAVFSLMSDETALRCLADPAWRLSSLYWVINKDGQKVKFTPWQEQQKLLDEMWYRNMILKARQRGFSTVIQLLMLDTCLFNPHKSAAVVAHGKDPAEIIFRDKIKFAYDNLPDLVKAAAPLKKDSASELILGNNSSLRVATSSRSGTLQFLHVSEFGKICAEYPDKAREVITGSLPSVAMDGLVFIESTAEGREGPFYEMTQTAKALMQEGRKISRLEYKFHFAPWWTAEEYRADPTHATVTGADHDYFTKLEHQIQHPIDPEQRAWYVLTRNNQFAGDRQLMWQEYPGTPEEAFEQAQEGVYYAQQLALARQQGRICDLPYDPRLPVNTFWDLGRDDDLVIWFHQKVGSYDHWIDYYETTDAAFSTVVGHMQSLGYIWGRHYLPHDGNHRQYGITILQSPRDMLETLGLRNVEIVPKTPDVTMSIRQCRDAFGRYKFDRVKTAPGIHHIDHYRKSWNERTGAWSDIPLKNGHQHAPDALRQHSQMFYEEPAVTTTSRPKRRAGALAV